MTTTYLIAVSNGEAIMPDQKLKCKHCSNSSTVQYLGMELCYSHFLAEELVNE